MKRAIVAAMIHSGGKCLAQPVSFPKLSRRSTRRLVTSAKSSGDEQLVDNAPPVILQHCSRTAPDGLEVQRC
jgi:hypothetical protein